MSDGARKTTWKGIKKNLKKPFVRKQENEIQGKKLMITVLISIETCKSTVLLKDAFHISRLVRQLACNNAKEVGWWILPYMS